MTKDKTFFPVFQAEYVFALLGSVNEPVVATDENFIIQYWSKGAEEIFGFTSDEVLGKRGSDVLNLVYPEGRAEQYLIFLANNGYWKGRLQYENKNRKHFLLDISVANVKSGLEEVMGYLGVYKDITEYDHTEEDISTFLSIISSTDDSFIVVDKKLRVVYIDDKKSADLKSIYEISFSVGDDVLLKLRPERKELISNCFNKALNGEKSSYDTNVKSAVGKSVWLHASYIPVKDRSGNITHACALFRDITAQKENDILKERLCKSREQFETFMENSPILSWISDSSGTLRYFNPAYKRTYGASKDRIINSISASLHQAGFTAITQGELLLLSNHKSLKAIEKEIDPLGKEHIYHVVKFPIVSEGEMYIGGWAIDITEEAFLRESLINSIESLRKSETELKDALEKEHALNDLKSRFVSMASHEFRTPLSTILSSTYLLEQYDTTEQQGTRVRHLKKISESINYMNCLLDDFLTLKKLDEQQTTVSFSKIDIHQSVLRIIEKVAPIRKPGQEIQYQHTGEREATTDAKLFNEIMVNLVTNAIKFSGENKKVLINSSLSKAKIKVIINDKGIGIDNEDMPRLFNSFFRGKNAQNIQGTGLGLHIVKRYVQMLNGEIELESKTGEGTTVTLTLPTN